MDLVKITRLIKKFINNNKAGLYSLSQNQSKILEIAGTVGIAYHYQSNGYNMEIINPKGKRKIFSLKTSSRGYPWNYSKIILHKDNSIYELHSNMMVLSAYSIGTYCVDVALVKYGKVPESKDKNWKYLGNEDLITFAEVKKLVIYPMLLAQFIGIVHEIKPVFISKKLPYGFRKQKHIFPTLISIGNYSRNSESIVKNFKKRKINILVIENYDIRIANIRGNNRNTPFYDGNHKNH